MQKDGNNEENNIVSNPYGLHNAVIINRLVEATDEIKALKDKMKEMQEYHKEQIKKINRIKCKSFERERKDNKRASTGG